MGDIYLHTWYIRPGCIFTNVSLLIIFTFEFYPANGDRLNMDTLGLLRGCLGETF